MTVSLAQSVPSGIGGAANEAPSASRTLRRRFVRSRRAVVGLTILLAVAFTAVAAPVLSPFAPDRLNPRDKLSEPFATAKSGDYHLLGTDQLGRDMLSRIFYGGRVSLGTSLLAIFLAGSAGVVIGLFAGFYGGRIDTVAMRLVDIQLAIPGILLAISIVAFAGRSLTVLVLVLALSAWIIFARTIRGVALSLRGTAFVEAAQAAGASDLRLIFRHILPNTWTPIIVLGTQQLALLIIFESSLSFIGAGAPADMPSWGTMVADGRDYILTRSWWLTTFPGLAISLVVLAINFFGDGLRDVLDPRLRL
jgi:peptide/nickel transport system permease protein